MPPVNIESIKSRFFAFGFLPENASPFLREKVISYGDELHLFEISGQGSFFYTTPFYAEVAEDAEMVWIKLGLAHDSSRRYSTREMVQNGWLHKAGIESDALQGSFSLVGFSKNDNRAFIFRNLISSANLVYRVENTALIMADNMRLLSSFMESPQLNQDVILEHHISRQVFGKKSYVLGVENLLGGELLLWSQGEKSLRRLQDFRRFESQENQKPVNQETVAWYFEQLKSVIGFRLAGNERQSATLLSGGVDSSTMQAAINRNPGIDFQYPSFSFVVDSPGFQFEVEYAKEAAKLLNTEHNFLKVEPGKFQDWLLSSISILGMPVHFDAPPSYFALSEYIQDHHPQIKYLFNGANADVLTGNLRSMALVQADKYRTWPIWLLNIAAVGLKPFSSTKSQGAQTAAETLAKIRDHYSIDNPYNRSSTCDWELVRRCFSVEEVNKVFQSKRDYLSEYSSSKYFSEQRQLLSLLQDGMSTPPLERQLGLYCGREMWFPFTDDKLVEAVYSFEPLDRYAHDYRVKPLMRMALESQIPTSVTRKPKGNSSAFEQAVVPWMREGSLRPLVQEIERPGYMSQAGFQAVLDSPDWFTWNLLTLDLFQKYGLK